MLFIVLYIFSYLMLIRLLFSFISRLMHNIGFVPYFWTYLWRGLFNISEKFEISNFQIKPCITFELIKKLFNAKMTLFSTYLQYVLPRNKWCPTYCPTYVAILRLPTKTTMKCSYKPYRPTDLYRLSVQLQLLAYAYRPPLWYLFYGLVQLKYTNMKGF